MMLLNYFHLSFFGLLFVLIALHCFGDFVFQGDFMAKTKNHTLTPDPCFWVPVLLAHSMVHAFLVFVCTGHMGCAIFMLITHIAIDFVKCQGWFGKGGRAFVADQLMHLVVVGLIATYLILFKG